MLMVMAWLGSKITLIKTFEQAVQQSIHLLMLVFSQCFVFEAIAESDHSIGVLAIA